MRKLSCIRLCFSFLLFCSAEYANSYSLLPNVRAPGVRFVHTCHTDTLRHKFRLYGEKQQIFDPFAESASDDASSGTSSPSINTAWGARAALLTVSALYGSNFGCVKILDQAMDPSFAAACRFSLASLVFMPSLLKQISSPSAKPLILGGLEVGIYCSIAYWAQAQALMTSTASTVAFICSLAVIVVPLLDYFFSSKRNKSLVDTMLPALLATFGVACLELGGAIAPGVGDLWACLQPLFFGLGFWRVETHMAKANGPGDVQAYTGAMMFAVAAVSWMWAYHDIVLPLVGDNIKLLQVIREQAQNLKDFQVIAAIFWTGVVTTALTSFVENIAMKKLTASESTVIYSTEPLWGTAFAAAVLHESVGWNTAVGAVLILSACIWSSAGPVVGTGLITSLLGSMGNALEEIYENCINNFVEFFESLPPTLPGEG